MLTASARLHKSGDIRAAIKAGRRIDGIFSRLHALLKSDQATTRVACVVSKSVGRLAVQRHRYQRWLRQAARQALATVPPATSYDIVLIAKPAMLKAATAAQVQSDVHTMFTSLSAGH